MSLFSRAHDILAAKANKALDSVENPDEMFDYSYEQMLDYITPVRQALVEIAAERKRIELQEPQLKQTSPHPGNQAPAPPGAGPGGPGQEAAVPQGRRPAAGRRDGIAAPGADRAGTEASAAPHPAAAAS